MPQKFKISLVNESGGFHYIFETSTVKEELFSEILIDKVKLHTKDLPEQFKDAHARVLEALKAKPVTVGNFQFEITGKP